jgi:GDP-4-dehydro-6-deoxy-D-mannose reductase
MRVLITGVNGFIGGSLWRFLSKQRLKLEVFGLDVGPVASCNKIFVCDLNHKKNFLKVLSSVKPDVIFHAAGGRMSDKGEVFKANFLTTKSLLETIEKDYKKTPRIIIPGTAAEYGQPPQGQRTVTEKTLPQPGSWYGFVKYMQSILALSYAERGLDVIVARIFNVLGFGTPPGLAMGRFAQEIVRIEERQASAILKTGDLKGKRDFLDIEDVCAALLALARKGRSGEVYNVCSGRACTIRALLDQMISCSGRKDVVVKEGKAFSESCDIVGSNVKIKKTTGWRPKVSLKDSLNETLEFYRRERERVAP